MSLANAGPFYKKLLQLADYLFQPLDYLFWEYRSKARLYIIETFGSKW